MIVDLRVKNCYVFEKEVVFSLKADLRSKKFGVNVHQDNNFNVLKTAGIYGQNNVGKSCLIRSIDAIKNIILYGDTSLLQANLFSGSQVCELGITFLNLGHKYSFDFKYDTLNKVYTYEEFKEIEKDKYGNEKDIVFVRRSVDSNDNYSSDSNLSKMMDLVSNSNLIYNLVDVNKFSVVGEMKNILYNFANKIDIINMNNIPLNHTIELMKKKSKLVDKMVSLIKNADLSLDNFEMVDEQSINVDFGTNPEEKVLDEPEKIMDQIRLASTYKGHKVPSMMFDSTGTKKIEALASYIIEGLEEGRILVIDELDSSIHFKLTRAIVSMFNNELNDKAQMIFTVHDINLMDCKRMFRKEQIWFINKDEEGVYAYSLADFKALDGVRDTTDVIEKYKKGLLGALPEPDLIETLLDLKRIKGE